MTTIQVREHTRKKPDRIKNEARLSYSDVARLLKPDFETGKLFWLPRTPDIFTDRKQKAGRICARWNSRWAGAEAFTSNDGYGYRHGRIFGRPYKAHRVLWLLANGEWPLEDIDHINGSPSDNRIDNLRSISHAENLKNLRTPRTNTSGVIGVSWSKRYRRWHAYIKVSGRKISVGSFSDIAGAISARKDAEIQYGFHENHGRMVTDVSRGRS